jgi:subtilisin family serine protease
MSASPTVGLPSGYRSGVDEAIALVRLRSLMDRTAGRSDIVIGILDGPVAANHPELSPHVAADNGTIGRQTAPSDHGTFVAGVLAAKRTSSAPAIAPGCTLISCPVFAGDPRGVSDVAVVLDGILDCVRAGARVLNLSAVLLESVYGRRHDVEAVLGYVLRRGAILVAAAGNNRRIAGSSVTRHPGVLPVVAYAQSGGVLRSSDISSSIGIRGVGGPGDRIAGLGARETLSVTLSGTSVATPFVAGTAALLWSCIPSAEPAEIMAAIRSPGRRRSIIPPLLDATRAFAALTARYPRR